MAFPKLAVRSRYGEHRSPASASLPPPHFGRSAKERLEALGYVLSLLPTGSCPLHLPPFLPSLGLAPPRRCRQARSHRLTGRILNRRDPPAPTSPPTRIHSSLLLLFMSFFNTSTTYIIHLRYQGATRTVSCCFCSLGSVSCRRRVPPSSPARHLLGYERRADDEEKRGWDLSIRISETEQ